MLRLGPQASRLQPSAVVDAPVRVLGVRGAVSKLGFGSYVGLRKTLPLRTATALRQTTPSTLLRRGPLQVHASAALKGRILGYLSWVWSWAA